MKKKTAVLVISYFSAAVVLLGVLAATQSLRARRAERADRYAGELAFEELCAAVAAMNRSLEKSVYATSPAVAASLCAETRAGALAAAASLGQLPMDSQQLEQTAGFLWRAGDCARELLRKTAGGGELTAQEREELAGLSDTAALLWDNLSQLRADITDGLVTAEGDLTLGESFLRMEGEFPDLSAADDDAGADGDGVGDAEMLRAAARISETEAQLVAAGFLGLRANLVSSLGRVECEVPVWRVLSGDYTVSVSEAGGHVTRVISSRAPGRSQLETQDARERAQTFLREHGYAGMTERAWRREGNIMTVSFCARQEGVLCCADTVRVAIAMDTGELAGFDAMDYLLAHHRRELAQVAVPAGEAKLPESLSALSSRLVLLPDDDVGELLCHEFLCENGQGGRLLVYVNAVTGAQERILLRLEDENGAVTV